MESKKTHYSKRKRRRLNVGCTLRLRLCQQQLGVRIILFKQRLRNPLEVLDVPLVIEGLVVVESLEMRIVSLIFYVA